MKKEVKSLSQYEWASGTKYILWVSGACGLEEINMELVYGFRLGKNGAKGLVEKKVRLRKIALLNMQRMERWVGENKQALDEDERAILISMYNQFKGVVSTCNEHIDTANKLNNIEQMSTFVSGDPTDDFPF